MWCLFRRAQRRRRAASEGTRGTRSSVFARSGRSPTPLGDDDYFVVDRESGDGSPRHSGEEADPFLRAHAPPQMRQAPVHSPNQFGVRDSMASSNPSNQQTMTSGTNESGYGTLLRDRFDESTPFMLGGHLEQGEQDPPSSNSSKRGRILSPDDQQQISDESESMVLSLGHGLRPQPRWPPPPPGSPPPDSEYFSPSEHYRPLLPPPRLVEATHRSGTPFLNSHNTSSASFDEDEGALLTAQRVRVGSSVESAPRVIPVSQASSEAHDSLSKMPSSHTQTSDAGPSAWRRVTNFFTRQDSTSSLAQLTPDSTTSASSPLLPVPGVMTQLRTVSDSYRSGDNSRPVSASISGPFSVAGFLRRPHSAAAAERPLSTASSKGSGGTVYHDAREELWSSGSGKGSSHGTGSGKGTPLTGYPGEWGGITSSTRPRGGDNSYGPSFFPRSDSPRIPLGLPQVRSATPPVIDKGAADYLDSPPPTALSSFQPISVPAPSVTHARAPFFPPGLGVQRSAGGGGLDVLEEEPPRAAALWQTHISGKRSTFGLGGIDLESTTLGTVRTRELHPSSTGSSVTNNIRTLSPTHLPPSRRMVNDSNPNSDSYSSASAVSVALSRSGSVTSDGRRRRQENSSNSQSLSQGSERGPMAASLSAFGSRVGSRVGTPAPRHEHGGSDDSALHPLPASVNGPPMNMLHHSPGSTSASATLAGTPYVDLLPLQDGIVPSTAGTNTDSSGASVPLEDFPDVPWAMGLDKDWKAR
jgi:hypothetical protein